MMTGGYKIRTPEYAIIAVVMTALSLITGCAASEPTAASGSTTDTPHSLEVTSAVPTDTLIQPTASLTPTDAPELTSTTTPLQSLTGSGGGVIAFSSRRDGNEEIYVMNADGSDQRRLTNHPASDSIPSWSRDGTQLVFTVDRNGYFETYVMDADGNNQQSRGGGGWSIWSPNGDRIAFVSTRAYNFEIYVMNADGSDRRRLTNNDAQDWEPAWSPDGYQIVFVCNREGNGEVYVMNAEGSDQKRVTHNQTNEWNSAWSPDGRLIAFITDRDDPDPVNCFPDCNYEIYMLDLQQARQGIDTSLRLTVDGAQDIAPVCSPNGKRLAFFLDRDGDMEIYVMN